MAREKYQTLTEQMFYVLLCLQEECCGVDIMKMVSQRTGGRIGIGPGTLYSLLDNFSKEGIILETKVLDRKKSYIITEVGHEMIEKEVGRLRLLLNDYEKLMAQGEGNSWEEQ